VSVVITTTSGSRHPVDACLRSLARSSRLPFEVLVVDASEGARTSDGAGVPDPALPSLRRLRAPGSADRARAAGAEAARGDVVAFLADDATVSPIWLEELARCYTEPAVTGVGGRVVDPLSLADEASHGLVGRLLADGRLTRHFSADLARVVEVDHLPAANMSFRRSALDDAGRRAGASPGSPGLDGTAVSLRQRALGRTLLFNPRAVVRRAVPELVRGRPGGVGASYAGRRDHVRMLADVHGRGMRLASTFVRSSVRQDVLTIAAVARAVLVRDPGTRSRGTVTLAGAILRGLSGSAGAAAGRLLLRPRASRRPT